VDRLGRLDRRPLRGHLRGRRQRPLLRPARLDAGRRHRDRRQHPHRRGERVRRLHDWLEAGTFVYTYSLLVQQAASTSDGPQFGINFSTGTAAVKAHGFRFWDATSAITAQTFIVDNIGVKGFGYISGGVSNAYTTTAPDMGTTVGVAATGANLFVIVEGIIVVTVQGNLELWRASEGANASTTEVGSSSW
jgi:hypothetical protein